MSARRLSAFTLIEMLVVIAIIAILAALLMPAFAAARERARKASCKNNLHTLMLGIEMYKQAYEDFLPPWLSTLTIPNVDMVRATDALICPSDTSRGLEGGRPEWFKTVPGASQFSETDDTQLGDTEAENLAVATPIPTQTDKDNALKMRTMRNKSVERCSYIYEFSSVWCSWWQSNDAPYYHLTEDRPGHKWADYDNDGTVSWAEAKQTDVKGLYWDDTAKKVVADSANAFGAGVPIVRCFWHATRGRLLNKETAINLACESGEIYDSTAEGDGWKNYLRGSH